jgi:3',5'-cyclic AMP phosphodiesterase CpdA
MKKLFNDLLIISITFFILYNIINFFSADRTEYQDFNFIVFGDIRPALPAADITPGSRRILEEISLIKPDLLFNVGDLIWGYGQSEEMIKKEFDRAFSLFSKLPVPMFVAPGNHDFFNSFTRKVFKSHTNREDYFSFHYKGAVFIVLNTEMPGNVGDIAGEQRKWLELELKKNKKARAIFIFMHRPLFSFWNPDCNNKNIPQADYAFVSKKKRDSLVKLLTKYKVTAVFSGHEHGYFKTIHKGIPFITTAGGGAPFSAKPEGGGFFNYVVVSMVGDKVHMRTMEPFHFFVEYKYYDQVFAEAQINNISFASHRFPNQFPIILKGIKFTLPKGGYALKVETIPPLSELLEIAGKKSVLREITQNANNIIDASIYKIEENKLDKQKVDIWVRAVSPGTVNLKLTVSPKEINK